MFLPDLQKGCKGPGQGGFREVLILLLWAFHHNFKNDYGGVVEVISYPSGFDVAVMPMI